MPLIWGQNSNIPLQIHVLPNVQLQMMPEASDKGSQPYSRAYGYGEMAGTEMPPRR